MKRLSATLMILMVILNVNAGNPIVMDWIPIVQPTSDIKEKESRKLVWSISTAPISDARYRSVSYDYADSMGYVFDNVFSTFLKDGNQNLLLTSVENRTHKISFDVPLTILPDSTESIKADLNGVGTYCNKLKFNLRGDYQAGVDGDGVMIIDNDTIRDVELISRRWNLELLLDADNESAYLVEEKLWFLDRSLAPIVKTMIVKPVNEEDSSLVSSNTFMIEREIIDKQLNDMAASTSVGRPAASGNSFLPPGLDIDLKISNHQLILTFSDKSGESYDIEFDVYNSLGQRLAPTVYARCNEDEARVTIGLLTNQSGVYFVNAKVNDSVETFKVTQ